MVLLRADRWRRESAHRQRQHADEQREQAELLADLVHHSEPRRVAVKVLGSRHVDGHRCSPRAWHQALTLRVAEPCETTLQPPLGADFDGLRLQAAALRSKCPQAA